MAYTNTESKNRFNYEFENFIHTFVRSNPT